MHAEFKTITQALQGDQESFTRLYNDNKSMVYKLLLRMTNGNVSNAEDLMQDTFMKAFTKLSMFRGNARFYTWLHRIAINEFNQSHRRKHYDVVSLEETVDDRKLQDTIAVTDLKTKGVEDRLIFDEIIPALPPVFKDVFIMHTILGYENKEIARMYGVSLASIKAKDHRAKIHLKQILTGEYYGPQKDSGNRNASNNEGV